jgi:TolB-like protein/Tfp pilus assembly protein PilF
MVDRVEADNPQETTGTTQAAGVFISYASLDSAIAETACDALEKAGVTCWIAPRDVTPGAFYGNEIVHAIDAAKAIVLILSQNAATSPHVLREVERAASKRHAVISLRIDKAPLPAGLEYFLNTSQWLDASSGDTVRTLPKLVAAVQAAIQAPTVAPAGVPTARAPAAAVSARLRKRMALVVASAVGLALVGFAADRLWLSSHRAAATPATTPVPSAPMPVTAAPAIPEKSVAVLPFVNMSGDKNNEYFSEGLSEELIGLLTKIPDLKVPARTSSFYFKGKQTTIAEIAKALGVAHVLEGSVRKSGDTLRITAQLVRVNDGYDIWSETYDRKLDDIFKVQDEISGAVVKALKVTLLEEGMPKAKPAANQEAYALFLQSRSLHYRGTHADVEKAIAYAERAVKLDPGFAPAWAAIADSLVYEYGSYGGSYPEMRARAYTAAQTALRLDPNLSDAHLAMGRVLGELDWDWPAAEVALQKALALDPNNVLALEVSSSYALNQGRRDDALRLAQKAATLDAVGVDAYDAVGDVQLLGGRLADAEAAYRKATELNPTRAGPHFELGAALLARGEAAGALAAMQQETDEGMRHYGLALAFDALGRRGDADQELAALETRYADSRAENIASVYACREQLEKAFAWLDRAYRQRDGWLTWIKLDPCVKNLQSDTRFKVLLEKLNLPY